MDIFAVVALDERVIGYIRADEAKTTMLFLPEKGYVVPYSGNGAKTRLSSKKLSEYKIENCL